MWMRQLGNSCRGQESPAKTTRRLRAFWRKSKLGRRESEPGDSSGDTRPPVLRGDGEPGATRPRIAYPPEPAPRTEGFPLAGSRGRWRHPGRSANYVLLLRGLLPSNLDSRHRGRMGLHFSTMGFCAGEWL